MRLLRTIRRFLTSFEDLACSPLTTYNVLAMDESRVEVSQLLRRDPVAWTALLSSEPGLEDVVVTAVTGQPILRKLAAGDDSPRVTRYVIVLADHSDPITLIGKESTATEAYFYRDLAPTMPFVAPYCYLTHVSEDRGWIILDDVPNDRRPEAWTAEDVEDVVDDMAAMHASYWDQPQMRNHYPWLPHFTDRSRVSYSKQDLRKEFGPYFEEGPAALVSDHALNHLGRLAPRYVQAANGLEVMRALGGWPGVLGESHLTAVADLLDDPVPLLEPLSRLPQTLMHGDMHLYHWNLTLFDQRRLLDWTNVTMGPSVLDLVSFQERFDLLFTDDEKKPVLVREESPADEETIIDSYMLAMKAALGSQFDAREARNAIPAARCLHVILNWFPYFASWFDSMPDVYSWQRINRMSESELQTRAIGPIFTYRPFLKRVFRRFLHAYRML